MKSKFYFLFKICPKQPLFIHLGIQCSFSTQKSTVYYIAPECRKVKILKIRMSQQTNIELKFWDILLWRGILLMTMNGTTNIRCCWERVHINAEKLYSGAGQTALKVRDSTESCFIRLCDFPLSQLKKDRNQEKSLTYNTLFSLIYRPFGNYSFYNNPVLKKKSSFWVFFQFNVALWFLPFTNVAKAVSKREKHFPVEQTFSFQEAIREHPEVKSGWQAAIKFS